MSTRKKGYAAKSALQKKQIPKTTMKNKPMTTVNNKLLP